MGALRERARLRRAIADERRDYTARRDAIHALMTDERLTPDERIATYERLFAGSHAAAMRGR